MYDLRTDVSADVLYSRNDSNDPHLGDRVKIDRAEYDECDTVLLGCPQDEGVRRNKGRPGARKAPDAIRQQLYKLGVFGMDHVSLFDLGDTIVEGNLEAIHERHQRIVETVLRDGKRLIALGGGNDISYPDMAGLAQVEPNAAAVNIDAHFDVRADTPRNSGTPYRQLLSEGHLVPERFFEVGYQPHANSPAYFEYLADLSVRAVSLDKVQQRGIERVLSEFTDTSGAALFWGFDMDAVRASDAPGVSAPNANGLAGTDLIDAARVAGGDPRTRVFEITEVNPQYDIDNRTSRLAAVVIWHFLHTKHPQLP